MNVAIVIKGIVYWCNIRNDTFSGSGTYRPVRHCTVN